VGTHTNIRTRNPAVFAGLLGAGLTLMGLLNFLPGQRNEEIASLRRLIANGVATSARVDYVHWASSDDYKQRTIYFRYAVDGQEYARHESCSDQTFRRFAVGPIRRVGPSGFYYPPNAVMQVRYLPEAPSLAYHDPGFALDHHLQQQRVGVWILASGLGLFVFSAAWSIVRRSSPSI
jgi:hypothetical protein